MKANIESKVSGKETGLCKVGREEDGGLSSSKLCFQDFRHSGGLSREGKKRTREAIC